MSILDQIAAYKREEVERQRILEPLRAVEDKARQAPPPRGFSAALRHASRTGIGIIAEIKKASPSKGLIRDPFDPARLAADLTAGGASCLSVLTDGPSFCGAPEHLQAASMATGLPCLRKDFILDTYQVPQTRAMGADCMLIILAMTPDPLARDLLEVAEYWGLDSLVEVHDELELERAARLGARMIGINNRNLRSFETSLDTTVRLAPSAPKEALLVAESGIRERKDLERLINCQVRSFLVGESLMRRQDVAAAVRQLMDVVAA